MNIPWIWISLLILTESLGAAAIRYSVEKPSWTAVGVSFYAAVGYILHLIEVRGVPLAITNAIWNASSTVTFALISVFLFGAVLTAKQWTGVFLVIVGAVFALGDGG